MENKELKNRKTVRECFFQADGQKRFPGRAFQATLRLLIIKLKYRIFFIFNKSCPSDRLAYFYAVRSSPFFFRQQKNGETVEKMETF